MSSIEGKISKEYFNGKEYDSLSKKDKVSFDKIMGYHLESEDREKHTKMKIKWL